MRGQAKAGAPPPAAIRDAVCGGEFLRDRRLLRRLFLSRCGCAEVGPKLADIRSRALKRAGMYASSGAGDGQGRALHLKQIVAGPGLPKPGSRNPRANAAIAG